MDINIIEILSTFGTIMSGIGIGWLSKSGRMKEKADAYKKMGEAYQFRIDALHEDVGICNKTIKELQERIAELNHALDDKTDIIRKYVADMMRAENEVNNVNEQLIDAQKEIAELKVEMEKKRCDDLPCPFRLPPNAHTPVGSYNGTKADYAKGRGINIDKE